MLTEKLVNVLNVHAPWIMFQQRSHFSPWITIDTTNVLKGRDKLKEKAKVMASADVSANSPELTELWLTRTSGPIGPYSRGLRPLGGLRPPEGGLRPLGAYGPSRRLLY